MAKIRLERVLAVTGAAAVLVVGFDSLTYAATEGSMILGQLNSANHTTSVTSTGSGPALSVAKGAGAGAALSITVPAAKAATSPPLSTNARGKVANLYAARAGTADNASKLGGKTLAEIQNGAKGSSSIETVSVEVTAYAGASTYQYAWCPTDKVATGGGYIVNYPADVIVASYPSNNGDPGVHPPTNWRVGVSNSAGVNHQFGIYVVCMS